MKEITVLSLFDGKYEIQTDGRVFSNVGKRKELYGKITNCGYRMVLLHINEKRIYKNVHRLVAENFILNPYNYPEVNHKDGNKLNNNVNNLEWVTKSQNLIHNRDILHKGCKIDKNDATKIRELYKTGNYSHKSLGELFGLKKSQIGYIIQNKRWKIETY